MNKEGTQPLMVFLFFCSITPVHHNIFIKETLKNRGMKMGKGKKNIVYGLVVLLCVSSFSYWLYTIGKEDEYIATLSWVVADKKIVVDPGHGGIFPGKVGHNDIVEKEVNLVIAKRLAQLLSEAGAIVLMTRDSDVDLVGAAEGSFLQKQRADLKNRVDIAKEQEVDIFISIHCNSIPSPKWSGAQTFFEPENQESEIIAKTVQQELIKQLKNTKRQAIKREDTYLFRNLDIPAIIIECGFLSNPKEADLLTQEEYQHCIAFAIYSGLVKHFAQNAEQVSS